MKIGTLVKIIGDHFYSGKQGIISHKFTTTSGEDVNCVKLQGMRLPIRCTNKDLIQLNDADYNKVFIETDDAIGDVTKVIVHIPSNLAELTTEVIVNGKCYRLTLCERM